MENEMEKKEPDKEEEKPETYMMKFSQWEDSLEDAEDFIAMNGIEKYSVVILWEEEVRFEKKEW